MNKITIKTEFITLAQFLKFQDIINSGGEFKFFISNNIVLVNNAKEERKGRKLYKNDIVSINGELYLIC